MDTRQLILIQQFFAEARLTPAAETPFLRIRRALHLDLCVELALNVIVRDFGTPEEQREQGGRNDLPRHKLWDLADVVVLRRAGKTLPERPALKTLHELRNLAQHRGTAPSADEIRGTVEPVRSLLEFTCRDIYGLDFARLREWDVLEHALLRQWLDDCYEAADRGSPFLATAGCLLAFQRILACVRDAAAGPNAAALLQRHIRVTSQEMADSLTAVLGMVRESVVALEAELVAVSLGLSIADHFRFQRAARGVAVHEYSQSNWQPERTRLWPTDPEEERANAFFVVDYLGKAVVLLESAFPGVFAGRYLSTILRHRVFEISEQPA